MLDAESSQDPTAIERARAAANRIRMRYAPDAPDDKEQEDDDASIVR